MKKAGLMFDNSRDFSEIELDLQSSAYKLLEHSSDKSLHPELIDLERNKNRSMREDLSRSKDQHNCELSMLD